MLKFNAPRVCFVLGALLPGVSNSVKTTADGYAIAGSLTIKENTRPVPVQVARKADGAGGFIWQGGADVRLSDFGLKPPKAALGAIGTEDTMQVTFKLKDLSRQ